MKLLALACALPMVAAQKKEGHKSSFMIPVFEDKFDGGKINTDIWSHEITAGGVRGGNWEFQFYHNNRSNSFVEDGMLTIQPTLTSDIYGEAGVAGEKITTLELWGTTPADQCTSNQFWGCARSSNKLAKMVLNPVASARLRTINSFSFRYGRVEVVAKLPKGKWLKPSVWLLPEKNVYGGWPASGEIDMFQSRGNAPGYVGSLGGGYDTVSSSMSWGPRYDSTRTHSGSFSLAGGDTFADEFHTFGMYWDADELYTYVDNEDQKIMYASFAAGPYERGEYSNVADPWKAGDLSAPFDERFFLMLDVSVGGLSGYFPDGEDDKPWTDTSSDAAAKFFNTTEEWHSTWEEGSAFQIKSVKVWQTIPDFFMSDFAAASTPEMAGMKLTGGLPTSTTTTASSYASSLFSVSGITAALIVGVLFGFASASVVAKKCNGRLGGSSTYQSV